MIDEMTVMIADMADRIEELEAENRRLKGEIESMRAERLERDRTTLAALTGNKDDL